MAKRPVIKDSDNPPSVENAGQILSLIATGKAVSRPELQAQTGLSRVTVTHRISALQAAGIIFESDDTCATGGRPSRIWAIRPGFGHVLVANIGETQIQLALLDATATMIGQSRIVRDPDIDFGPEGTLCQIADGFDALCKSHHKNLGQSVLLAIGLSLPAPVDYENCRVYGPSVLAGWEEFDIAGYFKTRFDVPVYGENDVNAMTLHQRRVHFPDDRDLVFVKVGTGIGSGIISQNRLLRGARGVAGDIGHIDASFSLPGKAPVQCRCGKTGCLEAHAAGWALARDLSVALPDEGIGNVPSLKTARDVMASFTAGNPVARDLLAQGGAAIGAVLAGMISVLNPARIVIGGTLAAADDVLLMPIRDQVRKRCLPVASQDLVICRAQPAQQSELYGAALLALEGVFAPAHVEMMLTRFAKRATGIMV
ncbi:ROK family transcriptional regulator [Thalassospira marina]|uniref:Sugar kinase n=1 Tax=Thalassospira marina TaxID=2048283 RepID=A0A2N3KTW7_9PROT|nr:ROK family transcriptional regulator [Thalassospira marina]PKR53977.1 sugar kinase [Thalassospira marina]